MAIPALEGHPLVARVALELLLGVDVPERLGVEELVLLDDQLADRQPVALAVAPVLRGQAGLEDLAHLILAGLRPRPHPRRHRPSADAAPYRSRSRRRPPPSPIPRTSAAPGRPCSPPGARPPGGPAPWHDPRPSSASQASPSWVY